MTQFYSSHQIGGSPLPMTINFPTPIINATHHASGAPKQRRPICLRTNQKQQRGTGETNSKKNHPSAALFRSHLDNKRHFEKYRPLPIRNKQAILLIVQGDNLRTALFQLLLAQGYAVIAVATAAEAALVATTTPVALVLLHFSQSTNYGGWETYTYLRQHFSVPVMTLANLTSDDFTTGADPRIVPTIQPEQQPIIQNYLRCIELLLCTS